MPKAKSRILDFAPASANTTEIEASRICQNPSESDFLTLMRATPKKRLPAVARLMRRFADGEPMRESAVIFYMEGGDTREEAEAKANDVFAGVSAGEPAC